MFKNISVTITLRWDATQFAVIQKWLSAPDDAAKASELTEQLHTSQDKLSAAVASTSTTINS